MKDGVVLFVICMLVVGAIGWWYVRSDSWHTSSSAMVAPAAVEEPKKPDPAPRQKPKNPHSQGKTDISPEPVAVESRPSTDAPAAPPAVAAPAPRFPAVDQIAKGSGISGITETFGPPALAVTATN